MLALAAALAATACPAPTALLPTHVAGLTPTATPVLHTGAAAWVKAQQDSSPKRTAALLRRHGFRSGAISIFAPPANPKSKSRAAASWVERVRSPADARKQVAYEIALGERNVRKQRGPTRSVTSERVPGARGFYGLTKSGAINAANLWLAVGDHVLFIGALNASGSPLAEVERRLAAMAAEVRRDCAG